MGVFEDLYIKARSKIYKFSKKAGKYLDISKLKIKLAECENDINIKYQKIGEIIYNKIENSESLDKCDIIEFVNDINDLKKEQEDYKNKINSLKGKCICKFCNSLNGSDAQFCSSCGNNLIYKENIESDFNKTDSNNNNECDSNDGELDSINNKNDGDSGNLYEE